MLDAQASDPRAGLEGPASASPLPWVRVAPGAPYFITDDRASWTPIGQNEALPWPELRGLIGRRDLPAVEAYLRRLAASGVTCLRLMLEYAEDDGCYLEGPVGTFRPELVRAWDDLVAICARLDLRLLLTPYDTFFTWNHWDRHPYNQDNGGPCPDRTRLMACRETREAVKARLAFASRRWGGSGALFAWDIWNEAHPVQADGNVANIIDFIEDVGPFLRDFEMREHGRAHPQTMSVFGPELDWKPWLREPILRHPVLDFANTHIYEEGTIDYPLDSVAAAVSTGRIVREMLEEIRDLRPWFDTEHGPIHSFKDHGVNLPEPLDDEYFRHVQWAHLASGGAGGGMRWPNRDPHLLTPGMLAAQRALAGFLPLIDWPRFRRRNLNAEVDAPPQFACFACGDDSQALIWLLRTDIVGPGGLLRPDAAPIPAPVKVPGLAAGRYAVAAWDTRAGRVVARFEAEHDGRGTLALDPPAVATDLALAIRRA